MKKLLVVLAVVSALVLTFGCQQKAQTPGNSPAPAVGAAPAVIDSAAAAKIREELTAAQMKYAQAWNAKDINAISDVWSHDADIMLIPPATRDRLVGFDAVKKWYQDNFDAMDKIDFKIHELMIKVTPDGNSAVITYYVENDFTDKATGKAVKMTPRVCVIKTKENGQWKQIYGDASFSVAELTKAKPAPAKKAAPKK
ncbi:MAG: nuclear transport factor 2 family protein [Candidatus Latescibacter sp.]|nr:nuclear transport factor 2 family protein [Candidatus Latescibacter sp.]